VAIHTFTKFKAHQTRNKEFVRQHGEDVQAVNILTQLEKLKSVRAKVVDEYEFLSEHAHPNSLGANQYFASNPDANDVVTFSDGGQDPRSDLQWILIGCHMLEHFEAVLNRIDAELPALSEKGRNESPHLGGPNST